ncbi:MAG: carbohydrate porin [Alphaproteobacteria bacterium]|nr:carbohydrate porin [Alphaproteobacteria bacterium]
MRDYGIGGVTACVQPPGALMRVCVLLFLSIGIVPAAATERVAEDWALHGQSTVIVQYHPAFRSPYRGTNSLDPGSRGNETVNATAYLGARLWDGGEAWANGEIDQGFGLSNTLGIAAFPNGQGSKVGKSEPYFRLHRLFVRQSFDLGGEEEELAPAANQLGASRTHDNLVITIGKFSAVDVFDTNSYAHDPANDFLNWALIDTGSFDYAADAWGYSYGAALEWNSGDWSVRGGLFNLSRIPNGTELTRGFGQYQLDAELERRFQIFAQGGKAKILGFASRGNFGAYKDAVAFGLAHGLLPDTASVRRGSFRPGVAGNLEQGITEDLGVFLRAGLTDGSREADEFTDIDNSVAAGLSLKGTSWARGGDTVGLAFESGGISVAAQHYFAAGGLGVLVGDGRLAHYAREHVVEAYYSLALISGVDLTADYQFVANPAHNSDRGPVSVLGLRLHGQF